MEQTMNGEKRPKQHLTLEEQLARLEAKEQRAKEAEAKRKTKIAKLRSAMLLQKREAFEKVLSETKDPWRVRFRREIMNDPNWLKSEKEKAEKWHITIDEAIERDIDWIQERLSDEPLGLDVRPEGVIGVVQ